MTGRHTNVGAGAANPYAWAIKVDEMAHDGKDARISEDQIQAHNTSKWSDFFVIMIKKEEL